MQPSQMKRSFLLILALVAPLPTFAGGTLAARMFDIAGAKSLPWASGAWDMQAGYDRQQLVKDTMALLTPQTPVLVRMETMRRALIYANGGKAGDEAKFQTPGENLSRLLLDKLMARVEAAEHKGQADTLALFDAGFFVESWRYSFDKGKALPEVNGYELIKKASALQKTDATMEFAAALISLYRGDYRGDQSAYQQHLQKAVAGAEANSLLSRNMVRQLVGQGGTFEDLRAKAGLAQR